MSAQMPAPQCEKCGTVGVPSYLVLSPTLQYWRCPHCARIWTTLKSTIDQHIETSAQTDQAASARTHCPQCRATEVVDLRDVLHSPRAEYFRCRVCDCWWLVPVGKNGPATRLVFGEPNAAKLNDNKAG